MRKSKKSPQAELNFSSKRGGKRKGAGRKKKLEGQPNHVKRPEISGKAPLHITLKLQSGIQSPRSLEGMDNFQNAFAKAAKLGLKVIHFSLQSNHAHIIAEVMNNEALERGMKSLTVAIAHAINTARKTAGAVFLGRYHLHPLKTPKEVKNALKYVLFNFSKHLGIKPTLDPFSSVFGFKDLEKLMGKDTFEKLKQIRPPKWLRESLSRLFPPTTWLLRSGWQRAR